MKTEEYVCGLCGTEFLREVIMQHLNARYNLDPRSATLGDGEVGLLLTDSRVAVMPDVH